MYIVTKFEIQTYFIKIHTLEDKFTEILSSSAYAAEIYSFFYDFSRWSFESQILWQ